MGPRVSRNMGHPESDFFGKIILKLLARENGLLEVKAAELCKIEPHFNVLEVGFGPGIGLKTAFPYIKDGPGKLHGIDISKASFNAASTLLKKEIEQGKVDLRLGSVLNLPYEDNTFDRVFHVNSYYFWPDLEKGASEIYRVLKPGCKMICTVRYRLMKNNSVPAQLLLLSSNISDPDVYTEATRKSGFKDVCMEDIKGIKRLKYQVIYGTKP